MLIRRFRVTDLDAYRGRAVETWAEEQFDTPSAKLLEFDAYSHTAVIDGVPVASAGIHGVPGRLGFAWAVMTPLERMDAFKLCRVIACMLRAAEFDRIETFVAFDFEKSMRWVWLLGFEPDTEAPFIRGPGRILARYIYKGD